MVVSPMAFLHGGTTGAVIMTAGVAFFAAYLAAAEASYAITSRAARDTARRILSVEFEAAARVLDTVALALTVPDGSWMVKDPGVDPRILSGADYPTWRAAADASGVPLMTFEECRVAVTYLDKRIVRPHVAVISKFMHGKPVGFTSEDPFRLYVFGDDPKSDTSAIARGEPSETQLDAQTRWLLTNRLSVDLDGLRAKFTDEDTECRAFGAPEVVSEHAQKPTVTGPGFT